MTKQLVASYVFVVPHPQSWNYDAAAWVLPLSTLEFQRSIVLFQDPGEV